MSELCVSLVEFMDLLLNRVPGGVTVGDSGLLCPMSVERSEVPWFGVFVQEGRIHAQMPLLSETKFHELVRKGHATTYAYFVLFLLCCYC